MEIISLFLKVTAPLVQIINILFNPFALGILYFFWSPVQDYFQWKFEKKKILAITKFSVNETMSGQANKRLIHWHFEN